MGLGTLIGTVVGALGGAGLAVAYNHKKEVDGTAVTWSDEAMCNFFTDVVLLYLAVAHFGRGRGSWEGGECPPFWKTKIEQLSAISPKNLPTSQALASVVSQFFVIVYKAQP